MDGRDIDPVWLKEMVELYSPDNYVALIWWEHRRYFGNLGKVHSLKWEKEKNGKIGLYARLCPNARLIELNDQGQSLFTSMEIKFNFDDTGKAYMDGLAVTDSPASLGTQELKFSKQNADNVISEFFSIEKLVFQEEEEAAGSEENLLKRIANHFNLTPKTKTEGDETMNEQQFENFSKQMTDQFSAMTESIAALSTGFTSLSERFSGDDKDDQGSDSIANNGPVTAEMFAELKQGFEKLESENKALSLKLTAALNDEEPGSGDDGDDGSGGSEFTRCL